MFIIGAVLSCLPEVAGLMAALYNNLEVKIMLAIKQQAAPYYSLCKEDRQTLSEVARGEGACSVLTARVVIPVLSWISKGK